MLMMDSVLAAYKLNFIKTNFTTNSQYEKAQKTLSNFDNINIICNVLCYEE
jgi:hypothetical protein